METLSECFKIILTGGKEASRRAARRVRKIIYGAGESDKYEVITSIIENAPKEYGKISKDWRQENFAVAVSVLYFLHNREKQPDFLFPWMFVLLQHPNGNIRHSAVRMFRNELGPLTYHIRFPNEKRDSRRGLLFERADQILFELFMNLMNLINDLWKPAYRRHKYVASLPSGPYKSVQMVIGQLKEYCGEEYVSQLERRLGLRR